jgi:hypothetical protein
VGTHEPGGLQTFSTHIRFHVHGWNNQPWILSSFFNLALSMAIFWLYGVLTCMLGPSLLTLINS